MASAVRNWRSAPTSNRDSGETEPAPAAGLFVLIGAQPFTGWLPEAIRRDQWGFILTGPDTGQHWPLHRAPFLLETTIPGVFAAGDARHGSIKRVASAVGDGSIAIRLVHDYLALVPPESKGHEPRLQGQRCWGNTDSRSRAVNLAGPYHPAFALLAWRVIQ